MKVPTNYRLKEFPLKRHFKIDRFDFPFFDIYQNWEITTWDVICL